jgi:hypothetical protein
MRSFHFHEGCSFFAGFMLVCGCAFGAAAGFAIFHSSVSFLILLVCAFACSTPYVAERRRKALQEAAAETKAAKEKHTENSD